MRKGFLLAVALVAFLFPLGAGAAEKVWSNSVPDSVWSDGANWVPAGVPASVDHVVIGRSKTIVGITNAAFAGGLLLSPDVSLDIRAGHKLTLGSGDAAVNIELEGNAEIRTVGASALAFDAVNRLNLNVPSSARLKLGKMSAPAAVHQSGGIVQLTGTVTAAAGGTDWHVNGGLLYVKKNDAFSGNMSVKVAAGKEVQFVKGADATWQIGRASCRERV